MTSEEAFWLTDLYPDAAALLQHTIASLEDVSGDCIVVLDANVLLWPYEYNSASLGALEKIYRKLAEEKRLIVPGQAVREFYKHRSSKIGAISEKIEGAIKKNRLQPFDKIALLENDADYTEARKLAGRMAALGDEIVEKLKAINSRLKDEIGSDPVSVMYRDVLPGSIVEMAMGPDERAGLLADAKRRARHEIAPGFKDAGKVDGGIGDLVIWKTLLQEATVRKCHAIFVTEEKKGDWWGRSNGAFHPRPELVEEFRQCTEGKSLHLLPLWSLLALFESPKEVVDRAFQLELAKDVRLQGALEEAAWALTGEMPRMRALSEIAFLPASPDSGEPCFYQGIGLKSRYNLASDIHAMMRIVNAMAPPLKNCVKAIWCDSKATACYTVEIVPDLWRAEYYNWLRGAFMVNDGHNGVYIQGGLIELHIDPEWKDDCWRDDQ